MSLNNNGSNPNMTINNATTWALSVFDSDLTTTQKLICLYLRSHMNDYHEIAFPAVGRIADKCSLSDRAVQKNLKMICEAGWLHNQGLHPKYGTHQYLIIYPPELGSPPNLSTDTPEPRSPKLNKELTNTNISKKRFVPPSLEEVRDYCKEKGHIVDPDYFYSFYDEGGWRDAGGNQVKSWKQKLITWNRREKQNAKSNGHTGKPKNERRLSAGERVRAATAARRAEQAREIR